MLKKKLESIIHLQNKQLIKLYMSGLWYQFQMKWYLGKHLPKKASDVLDLSFRFQHLIHLLQNLTPEKKLKVKGVVPFFPRNLKLHSPRGSIFLTKFTFKT